MKRLQLLKLLVFMYDSGLEETENDWIIIYLFLYAKVRLI